MMVMLLATVMTVMATVTSAGSNDNGKGNKNGVSTNSNANDLKTNILFGQTNNFNPRKLVN